MIRQKVMEKGVVADKGFRWRGHEVTRIEGLSDAVFGFAITLLVVSLEVPKTFGEMLSLLNDLGAFAISFLMLFIVWLNHYKFFRRYGLQDNLTVWLNAVLLFVVLFYVYPLKFLFTWLISVLTGRHGAVSLPDGTVTAMVQSDQVATLMIIYGVGYVAVFGIFVLFYLHAYRRRFALDLNELEIFDTRNEIQENVINVAVGLLSITIAAIGGSRHAGKAGLTYMLLGVVMSIHGFVMGKRRRKLEEHPAVAAKVA